MDAIVETACLPIMQVDSGGIINMVNKASCDKFLYSKHEMLGQHVRMIVPGLGFENFLKNCCEGLDTFDHRYICQKSNGETMNLFIYLSKVELGDGACGASLIFRDLSNEENEHETMLAMMKDSVDPIIQINTAGVIQYVNDACRNVFGYDRGEMIGHNVKMLMPEPYSSKHDTYLANYLKTGVKKVMGTGRKLRGRKKDGTTFPMELSLSESVSYNGLSNNSSKNGKLFFGVIRNLSSEEQERKRLKSIVESAHDPIIQIDAKGIIQMVNSSCCKIFMYEESDLVGQNVKMLMPEHHANNHDDYIKRYLDTGATKIMGRGRKLRAVKSDGSTFLIFLTISEALVGDKLYFTGIMRDLTSEEQYRENTIAIIDSAYDPVVQINGDGIIQFANDACCNVFGYECSDMVGGNIAMLMPEPHRTNHDQYIRNYLETGIKQVIGKGRKLRGKKSDGTTFPMFLSLSESHVGDELLFTGIMRDLSDAEQEKKRMTAMIESACDPIVQIDSRGIITLVNQACCENFMYTKDQMMGKNVSMLMPEPHTSNHDYYLASYINTGIKKVMGTGRKLRGRRSDGTTFPMFLSLSEAKFGDNIVFTGIIRDMSAEEHEREKMLAVINSSLGSVVHMNSHGVIEIVNSACCKLFGYKEHQMKGKNIQMIMPSFNVEVYAKACVENGNNTNPGEQRRIRGLKSDGSRIPLVFKISGAMLGDELYFTSVIDEAPVK